MLDERDYRDAVGRASWAGGPGGPEWNRRFTEALAEEGLMLAEMLGPPPLWHYVMAPMPYPGAEPSWRESWIVDRLA